MTRQPLNRRTARGVVLLYVMLCLVIMMIASVALVRSFDTSLFNAGNLAFKRDLMNQGERARLAVVAVLGTGGVLGSEAARSSSLATENYSAFSLPTNAHGIPNVLLSSDPDANFSKADITADEGMQVSIRYVLDRQCSAAGPATRENCVIAGINPNSTDDPTQQKLIAEATGVVYRLTIRVTGPRNTQAFLQSTFSL